jgi:hypothetical protein
MSRGPLFPELGSVPISPNSPAFVGSDRIASSLNNSTSYMPLSRDIDRDFPPSYASMQTEGNLAGLSTLPPVEEQDDELGRWAAENRSSVPYELEQKLRAAQYLPSDNPEEISPDVWRDAHGVGHFELKRLQEIYAR